MAKTLTIAVIGIIGYSCHYFNLRKRDMHFVPITSIELTDFAIGRYIISFPKGAFIDKWTQSLLGIGDLRIRNDITINEFNSSKNDNMQRFNIKNKPEVILHQAQRWSVSVQTCTCSDTPCATMRHVQ